MSLDERIAAARARMLDAGIVKSAAEAELSALEVEKAGIRARAALDEALEGRLSPELHGEVVADAARDHGGQCARAGRVSEITWRAVRIGIASFVRRLATAERQAAEARGELDALLKGLGLDDRPRALAIQHARETLARLENEAP